MSGDASAFGFGKFIPGFDFLQGLAQSAGAAANPMGRVPQWVAPTVSVEEVDKRIAELKAVQFWLEQNSRALTATIQALEVQRMTLSTLKDMNVSMSELAKSFPFPGAAPAEPAATGNTGWPMGAATAAPAAEPAAEPEPEAEPAAAEADSRTQAGPSSQAALSQAMQWWGALTQQFQQIAAKAMAEPVPPETLAAAQRATEMASGFAKSTMEKVMAQAGGFGTAAAAKTAEKSAATAEPKPARKAAAKTGQPKTAASKTAAAKKTAAKQPAAKKTTAKTSATSRKP
ncbi:PhaM family polyhydroxyalkanoate granule multifunctional regulatory protein [Comamonas sp. E6]|uniref:PhaM family polyhydroxyalkanoate granule multifunctional regulatory protein n=1 Tax=Comamonas sp. E6 TaxID=364029 RepID=UPI0006334C87|nr:PhaM family polyhydroxyalkanoate granule multifunctional regulatory protein [Comamonas sp. E6]GAO73300.1 hypothetical protein CSE6_035_47370 [Comamonas sp. E6]